MTLAGRAMMATIRPSTMPRNRTTATQKRSASDQVFVHMDSWWHVDGGGGDALAATARHNMPIKQGMPRMRARG